MIGATRLLNPVRRNIIPGSLPFGSRPIPKSEAPHADLGLAFVPSIKINHRFSPEREDQRRYSWQISLAFPVISVHCRRFRSRLYLHLRLAVFPIVCIWFAALGVSTMAFNPNGLNVNHSVDASGRPVLIYADRRSETLSSSTQRTGMQMHS